MGVHITLKNMNFSFWLWPRFSPFLFFFFLISCCYCVRFSKWFGLLWAQTNVAVKFCSIHGCVKLNPPTILMWKCSEAFWILYKVQVFSLRISVYAAFFVQWSVPVVACFQASFKKAQGHFVDALSLLFIISQKGLPSCKCLWKKAYEKGRFL